MRSDINTHASASTQEFPTDFPNSSLIFAGFTLNVSSLPEVKMSKSRLGALILLIAGLRLFATVPCADGEMY